MQNIINLADDTSRNYARDDPRRVETHHGAIVSGPHAGYFIIDTAEQVSVLGISFTPGGAAPFLDMPASELRDLRVSIENICGSVARQVREQLLEAEDSDPFGIREDWLLARANGRPRLQPA